MKKRHGWILVLLAGGMLGVGCSNSNEAELARLNAELAKAKAEAAEARAKIEVQSAEKQPQPANAVAFQPTGPKPEMAKTPFDASQARTHQEAWAKYMGTTVESTNSIGAKVTLIPPGQFRMRRSDELPPSANGKRPDAYVVITTPYLMGTTEVTVGQFKQFVDATHYVTAAERFGNGNWWSPAEESGPQNRNHLKWSAPGYTASDDFPVTQVTWTDAVAFCNWLSEQNHLKPCYRPDLHDGWVLIEPRTNGYRLPTDAEWEFACWAGATTQYPFGDDLKELGKYAWYKGNTEDRVHTVGGKLSNPFGLRDMFGNAVEWCHDHFSEVWDPKSPSEDPQGPAFGFLRLSRGSCVTDDEQSFLSERRHANYPKTRYYHIGFRCARSL